MLTESQLVAWKKAKSEKEAHGEFESECPGYCGAQDTFYVGNMKGVGRIYPADLHRHLRQGRLRQASMNRKYADHRRRPARRSGRRPSTTPYEVKLCRVLTRSWQWNIVVSEHHEYELYLALEDVDHSRTKTKSPQTNGIVERFHKTVLDEFYRVAFRKKIYGSIGELHSDLD